MILPRTKLFLATTSFALLIAIFPLRTEVAHARGGGGGFHGGGGGGFSGSHGGGGLGGGFGGGSFREGASGGGEAEGPRGGEAAWGPGGRGVAEGPNGRWAAGGPDGGRAAGNGNGTWAGNADARRDLGDDRYNAWNDYVGPAGVAAAGAAAGLAVGATIGSLPDAAHQLYLNDQAYYYDGVNYYQPCYQGCEVNYCVVQDPYQ